MSIEMEDSDSQHLPHGRTPEPSQGQPLVSPPLKSAMKTPGAAPKSSRSAFFNPSTSFKDEEEALEKEEALTEKQQANDLVSRDIICLARIPG